MSPSKSTRIGNNDSGKNHIKHIVILGSGFAGIEALKSLQKKFKRDDSVKISLVSEENFLLFTPMLPEVMSGMIEMRHITTPVRAFCLKANFYQARVESIDFEKKEVSLVHTIGNEIEPASYDRHTLKYDYLVISLGSETNFFGMKDVERYSFTMKDIDDAIALRNHIISMLEQASLEEKNSVLRRKLLTFVVVGGGFTGVETVGQLNDFVRDTIRAFYPDIYMTDVRIVLVSSDDNILKEIDEQLGEYALQKLREKGVEFILNSYAKGASASSVKLDNGKEIPCYTIIWSTGVSPSNLVADLQCEHDKRHRIITNNYLEVEGCEGVYATGDCASITDPRTGKPYPPTAQHAIREARVAARNIIHEITHRGKKEKFEYKAKGMMAEIGKRNGVATVFSLKIHGFPAWWLWRTFYLSNLPTTRKKLKVMSDWTMDLFFKPDVTMFRGLLEEKKVEKIPGDEKKAKRGIREEAV
jgi:NADH:ubiquinone reductase (H+-translocating)